jgi:catalase
VRGFALKFYTDEGNWDLVGNNTPVFFVRDPLKVPRLHPHAEAPSEDQPALEDGDVGFLVAVARKSCTRRRRCSPIVACLIAPMHMNGYGSHTYSFWNAMRANASG